MANMLPLPIIDLSGYVNQSSPEDKKRVITQVAEACQKYGFFRVKGHGVALETQQNLLRALERFFSLPSEDKLKLSFLKNPCRRGYEASGMSLRPGDALPDSKECYFIGREDAVIEHAGFYGPNVWPDIPAEQFRGPVWQYYIQTERLGRTVWEMLLQGLGRSPDLMEAVAQRPMVQMKMLCYPPRNDTLPGQFGVGPHTDFGGVTILLQQPGKVGLEVWHGDGEGDGAWLPVPAEEDILVVNCGDMVQKWSGRTYKSVRHRVINRADTKRYSCATFWHGDVDATNPLNPGDPDEETVGQLLVKRFGKQFSLSNEVLRAAGSGT